jgi:hypothetical protein
MMGMKSSREDVKKDTDKWKKRLTGRERDDKKG